MSEGRADALKRGHRLHVYTLAEVLGAGGFGITYRAQEEFTDRAVAIKEFLPTVLAFRAGDGIAVRPISQGAGVDFAWGLERFRREARALYDLRHPNIVPVLQYFEANGTGYLVMEYQSGASLGQLLKPDKTLDPAEMEEIVGPLLDALAAIHAKGFLHRDVKPDNIFIRGDGVPLLLDFGAARLAIGERSQSLTTIISEGYAPFEQYESSGQQGPWTDLYAFGATLYRCMSGRKPPPATARAMAQMQSKRDPMAPIPPDARARYGAALVDAAEAALHVSASARPQSVADFRALLGDRAREPIHPPAAASAPAASTIALGEPAPRAPARRPPPPKPAAPPPARAAVPGARAAPGSGSRALYWAGLTIAAAGAVLALLGLVGAIIGYPRDAVVILGWCAAVVVAVGAPLWFAMRGRFFFYVWLVAGTLATVCALIFFLSSIRSTTNLDVSVVAFLLGLGITGGAAIPLCLPAAWRHARARKRSREQAASPGLDRGGKP